MKAPAVGAALVGLLGLLMLVALGACVAACADALWRYV